MDREIKVSITKDINYEEGKIDFHLLSIINIDPQENMSLENYSQFVSSSLDFQTKPVDMGSSFNLILTEELTIELSDWILDVEKQKSIILKHLRKTDEFLVQLGRTTTLFRNEIDKTNEIEGNIRELIDNYS